MARVVSVAPPCALREPPLVVTLMTTLAGTPAGFVAESKKTIPCPPATLLPLLLRLELKSMFKAPAPAVMFSAVAPSPITTSRSARRVRFVVAALVTVMLFRTLMSEVVPVAVKATSLVVPMAPVVLRLPALFTVKPPLVPVLLTPVIVSVLPLFTMMLPLPVLPALKLLTRFVVPFRNVPVTEFVVSKLAVITPELLP